MPPHSLARVVAVALVLCAASPAWARRPFDDTDLFTGHSIRQSSKDRKVAVGVNVHSAPVPYVARKALDKAVSIASGTGAYPDAKVMLGILEKSDAAAVEKLAKAGNVAGVQNQLRTDLKKAGVTPTAEQTAAIDNINSSNIGQVETIALVASGAGGDNQAIVVGVEPWAEYNFGTYDLTASLPFAAFRNPDSTDFEVGNLTLDFRAGSRRSLLGAGGEYLPLAIGWTGGVSAYLPTGTSQANRVALSNVLVLPKYLHEYASIQPYAIFAAEAAIFAAMLRLEYTHMQALRDKPLYTSVGYFNWAASLVARVWIVDLVGELDGLVEAYNAPAMNDIYATLGGRLSIGPVRLGVGARMPVTTHQASLNDQSFGVSFANVAKLNVLVQGILSF